MSTKEFATDAKPQSTLCETDGTPDTSSTVHVVGRTNGRTYDPSIRVVTLATQRSWETRWRQRLREFDIDTEDARSSHAGVDDTTP